MTSLEAILRDALEIFESPTEEFEREPGFEDLSMDDATRQLRKSCRALGLAQRLLDDESLTHDKLYTVVIELSFNSLERAAQAAMSRSGSLQGHHTRSHYELLKDSHLAGLWNQEISASLSQLFEDNRSEVYYRDGVPSHTRAKMLLDLAEVVHAQVTGWNRFPANECICE